MSLEVDNYDTAKHVEEARAALVGRIGPVGMRLVGPEVEAFIEDDLPYILKLAFSRAEAIYVDRAFKNAQESSGLLLKATLAGVELAEREHRKEGEAK